MYYTYSVHIYVGYTIVWIRVCLVTSFATSSSRSNSIHAVFILRASQAAKSGLGSELSAPPAGGHLVIHNPLLAAAKNVAHPHKLVLM